MTLGSSEWAVADLKGSLPLHSGAPSAAMSCPQNVFSVAVQTKWCVIIPTCCFGCGSSNIETGAAREPFAGRHPPFLSSTYSLELRCIHVSNKVVQSWATGCPSFLEGPVAMPCMCPHV